MNINNAKVALKNTEISIHCWQTDDVAGFEVGTEVSGGIQATGNYPGKARNKQEVFEDLKFVINNLSGKFRINLHASYQDRGTERDELTIEDFRDWIEFAKENNVKIDFNPTFFGHEQSSTGFTLSSEQDDIRNFWIEHGKRTLKIAEQIAKELDDHCLFNIWIPDGAKEKPINRLKHRLLLKDSLDKILSIDYDKNLVPVSVESKVFGIGLESYTVGSHEFYMNYANSRGINCLIDSGHFHPTENVADKLSSLLAFNDKVALHLTRPVRWDSDHVTLLNQDLTEITDELVALGIDKFYIGLDYFDASINRLFAYITGIRNLQKSILKSLLNFEEKDLELETTSMNILTKDFLKDNFDFNSIWNEYCAEGNVLSDKDVIEEIKKQETNILNQRK